MQEINAWLQSNKDFDQGKALYIKYGSNSFFKDLLQNQGSTPYNIRKLGDELEALAPAPPAIPDPVTQTDEPGTAPGTPAHDQQPQHDSKDFLKYLDLKEIIKIRYKQLERNMFELDASKKESVTFLIAQQIVKLDEQISDTWALIDFYDQNGHLPNDEEKPVKEYTIAERINHLHVSTSKAKTRLKSRTCRNPEATRQLIEENNKKILALKEIGKDE